MPCPRTGLEWQRDQKCCLWMCAKTKNFRFLFKQPAYKMSNKSRDTKHFHGVVTRLEKVNAHLLCTPNN